MMRVLDLFSAAAGGWSLGMHRAGFQTVAACEAVEWRRILYSENNLGVLLYDDVRTLTAERLLTDLGFLPRIIVGSPPPAKTSAAPTPRDAASKASVPVSSSKPSVSSEKSAIVGSLLRTALISELAGQTQSSLRWKPSATPAGRSWFVLQTSEPTTSAPGHGSSGATLHRLPTPMASDGMKDGAGGGSGSTYPFRRILATPVQPTASVEGKQINNAEREIVRKAMDLVTKTKKPMPEMADEIRSLFRAAADEAAKHDPGILALEARSANCTTRQPDWWLYEWLDADGVPISYKSPTPLHPDDATLRVGERITAHEREGIRKARLIASLVAKEP